MISAALYILSIGLVVVTSGLAITVSPLWFPALLLSLAVPAFLTVRSYQSPNKQQVPEPASRVRRVGEY